MLYRALRSFLPFGLALVVAFSLGFQTPVLAQKGTSHSSSHSKSSHSTSSHKSSGTSKTDKKTSTSTQHNAPYCETCARDKNGKILRGDAAKDAFKNQTGYPKGRPGYVIDHIVPLACGGKDDTSNMQWQTVAEAKAKDKVERKGCTK
jgi:hypothetical protein